MPFAIPNYLQVGTIDKLMTLSDELAKVDPQLGGLCRKLKRTYDEIVVTEPPSRIEVYQQQQKELLAAKGSKPKADAVKPAPLLVTSGTTFDTGDSKGAPPKQFLQQFRWSDITYGASSNVDKIKNEILSTFSRTDEELKVNLAHYNEAKTNILNYEKKVNGNLLVRPLTQYIDPKDIHFTQHLTTVILAVPRSKEEEFLQQYETIEFKYFEKLRAEEEKRQAVEEKEKLLKEQKEAEMGKKAAAEAKPEEEEEAPPTDEEIKAAQAKEQAQPTASVKPQVKIVLTPHPQYGLTTDDRYKFVPTVVPGSAKKIVGAEQVPEDALSLFRVICFKRQTAEEQKAQEELKAILKSGTPLTSQQQSQLISSANVEKWKSICRDYRWTVRPFVYDPNEQAALKQEIQTYVESRRTEWERLKTFCEEMFDSAYRAWIHIVAMRVFVEIRLRYGLGDNWLSFVVFPKKNQEKKVRDILAKLYTEKGTETMMGAADDGEYYPYVSISVDLTDMLQ